MHGLGRVAYFDRDQVAACSLGEQSLAVADALGDPWLIAWALHLLGWPRISWATMVLPTPIYEPSLAIRRVLGHHEADGHFAYRRESFMRRAGSVGSFWRSVSNSARPGT